MENLNMHMHADRLWIYFSCSLGFFDIACWLFCYPATGEKKVPLSGRNKRNRLSACLNKCIERDRKKCTQISLPQLLNCRRQDCKWPVSFAQIGHVAHIPQHASCLSKSYPLPAPTLEVSHCTVLHCAVLSDVTSYKVTCNECEPNDWRKKKKKRLSHSPIVNKNKSIHFKVCLDKSTPWKRPPTLSLHILLPFCNIITSAEKRKGRTNMRKLMPGWLSDKSSLCLQTQVL